MKLLLDENMPKRLQQDFVDNGFSTYSVQDMGWNGTKNGALLQLLMQHQFDALLTGDKNLEYQQNDISIPIIVFDARRLVYHTMQPLVTEAMQLLRNNPSPGVYRISI
jgi:rRNA-processing protein FCF1